jgi:hypothetical protein
MSGAIVGEVLAASGSSPRAAMTPAERRAWRKHVFGHADLTAAQKLVLLALETFADYPAGTNAHPGVTLLAETCGLGMRVVEGALHSGRELELIERTGRANPKRGRAASYRLLSTRTAVQVEDDSTRTGVRPENELQPARDEFQPAQDIVSTRTSVQPTNPLTPIQNTEGIASASLDDEPRCFKHQDTQRFPRPPGCLDCKQIRLASEARADQRASLEDAARDRIRRAIDNCAHCDAFGRLDDLTDCARHPNFRQSPARRAG